MSFTDTQSSITIENIAGITESTIINYFATINQEKFERTAALFAEEGELLAPFTQPIVGRDAIATYLAQEAKGMKLLFIKGTKESVENDLQLFKITGKVNTPLFSVNVCWHFTLNKYREITTVRIKLLASPQELLGLKKIKDS